jgi:hypothetical protein
MSILAFFANPLDASRRSPKLMILGYVLSLPFSMTKGQFNNASSGDKAPFFR